jgi:hypothetical protein
LVAIELAVDGDHVGGGDELAGVNGEVIGERAGVGVVFDESGDCCEAELFIAAGLAGMTQGPEEREAEE